MPDAVTRFLSRLDALLARLDSQLALATTPREVAWTVCEFTGRELNLADCVVYLPEGSDGLRQTAAWGPKRVADHMVESGIRLSLGKGIVGDCARQLHTQRVDDTRRDPRYVRDIDLNLSELAVPIHHDEILLGVLDSEHSTDRFYDARYEHAFEAIAEHGAARLWSLRGEPVAHQ
jgi:signal transduction protein with GAF and PtsI domain